MRLSDDEQNVIKTIIAANFGAEAEIWLFGSRVDDKKRGGDVDLYVVPKQQDDLFPADAQEESPKFKRPTKKLNNHLIKGYEDVFNLDNFGKHNNRPTNKASTS